MIPADFITEWRSSAPWIEDLQVEQDLILSRAIVELFQRSEVSRAIAFRGGTALYKLYLLPPARYSEDLDFVQIVPDPVSRVTDAVRAPLDPWLGTPRRTKKESSGRILYKLTSEGPPSLPMRLKVEINSREQFTVFGFESRRFEVVSRWFKGVATVKTFQLEELLGTKLRALYQRKKARDLFDIWIAQQRAKVDPDRMVQCFLHYMKKDGLRVSRAEFEANLHAKLKNPDFAGDMVPLLASGTSWNIGEAAKYVFERIAPRLPGEPWKGGG